MLCCLLNIAKISHCFIIIYNHAQWFAEAKSEKKEVSWFERTDSSSRSSGDDGNCSGRCTFEKLKGAI